jgi:hypothetical protein
MSSVARWSFGELIGLAAVSAGHFGRLFLLAFLLNLPAALLVSLENGMSKDTESLIVLMTLLVWLVFLLTAPLLQAATIRLVASSFTGESSSLGDCLRLAVRRMWPVLGYGMVTGLMTSLGALLCIVPGLICVTWYYMGAATVVVENANVGDAMARSKKLSEGLRWEVFAYFLVTNVLFQGVIFGMNAGLGYFLDPRVVPWVNLPFTSLLNMSLAVAPIVYYFNVRVAKEGFDLDRLSALIRGSARARPRARA